MAFGDLGKAKFASDLGDHAFVRRIAIGVHEHDRDGVVALGSRIGERGAHALRVGRRLTAPSASTRSSISTTPE